MKNIEELRRFYDEVDQEVRRLKSIHSERLKCKKGCASCCIDGITVFQVEAENIKFHYKKLLREEKPHGIGKCAFLDESGACRIYENRPYVCRTQGLPLRWLDEENEIEYRDICPLNENGEPIENLEPDKCLTIGIFESRLAGLQLKFGNGKMKRVALRSLFECNRKRKKK
ncbi:MAG: YkgJ family cysteine cluster protein [Acidobacteria bacterium]|jgi:Fe-S-cluster containining protein|nr:MAG: YkgJ family cysteine cluster protein [Acidobacteriota bacterium]GIU82233.1 MAG: hypothetical protein KatS3mg006_1297 [Pyrinomonadaceae bacterium]